SPSYEWLRGVWSRAYMTDAKRAFAIIGQPLDPDRLKGRRLDLDQLVGKIARIARVLHPDRMDDTTYRIDMDVSRDSEQARYVTEILERSDIPYALADTLDGKAITIDVDHSCIPAVKTILDGLCQPVKGFDQSLFPQWRELRREEGRILKENPGMRGQSRPVEPDWAATIAGRLNAGLLDRVNGTVHEEWCAGVIPRIRASRHGSELDIVRQNERLIELKVGELVRDAQASNQPWTGRILEASADDPTLFRDVVGYRAMWQVDEEDDPLGERPPTSSGGRNSIGPTSTGGSTTPTASSTPADGTGHRQAGTCRPSIMRRKRRRDRKRQRHGSHHGGLPTSRVTGCGYKPDDPGMSTSSMPQRPAASLLVKRAT
ncbi:MAG: hypothetical protein L0J23_00590, partial [Bifidobacterium crudilactis]|nr:hypothetical protein [Bifidobacterium crudilactis]